VLDEHRYPRPGAVNVGMIWLGLVSPPRRLLGRARTATITGELPMFWVTRVEPMADAVPSRHCRAAA
jgi:hypothetical protein